MRVTTFLIPEYKIRYFTQTGSTGVFYAKTQNIKGTQGVTIYEHGGEYTYIQFWADTHEEMRAFAIAQEIIAEAISLQVESQNTILCRASFKQAVENHEFARLAPYKFKERN
jgi:hypothetical protein